MRWKLCLVSRGPVLETETLSVLKHRTNSSSTGTCTCCCVRKAPPLEDFHSLLPDPSPEGLCSLVTSWAALFIIHTTHPVPLQALTLLYFSSYYSFIYYIMLHHVSVSPLSNINTIESRGFVFYLPCCVPSTPNSRMHSFNK